jgi:2'-5' RNA ligase
MDLFGFEPPPPPLRRPPVPREGDDRLFFALFPDPDAAQKMLELGAGFKSRLRLAGELHEQNRLHLTLDHLGDFAGKPQDLVRAAEAAAGALAAQCRSFTVTLDRVMSFVRGRKSRPLVLKDAGTGNPDLAEFRRRLWDALAAAGVPGVSRSSFTPHVTLLYDAQLVPEEAVGAIAWQAHELVLVHSMMKQTRYEMLGRWLLSS